MEIGPQQFLKPSTGGFQEMEDAMYEFTVMVTMLLVRIVLPVGLLLGIGELSRRNQQSAVRGM